MENLKFDIFNILSILIIYQGVAFAFMLIRSQKPKSVFNLILAIFTLTIACNFLNILLIKSKLLNYQLYFWLAYGLSYGPLFYLYARSLMNKTRKFEWKKDLIHLYPSCLAVFIILINYVFNTKLSFYNNWVNFTIILHLSCYLLFTLKGLKTFERKLKDAYSYIDKISLSWLNNLVYWLTVLIGLLLIGYIIPYSASDLFGKVINVFIYLTALFLINSLYYKGLRQPEVFIRSITNENGFAQIEKYKSSQLSKEEADILLKKILAFMKAEKPYLNSNITIDLLAEEIDISTRNLSQIINDRVNKNFFDFINSYRIEEAKRLLLYNENPRDRILEIMVDSGFNSKSTFNHVFKKSTGYSPSAFRKSNKNKV